MKATKMVYALITILILIPISVRRIKNMRHSMKTGRKDVFGRQFLYLLIALAIVFGFTISLYRFTIGYEAPLFAERVHEIFIEAGKNGLGESEFEELLYKKKLASPNIAIEGYDGVLNSIDFKANHKAYLSEKTYVEGDRENIYCRYIQGDETVYIEMSLNNYNNKWQISAFTVLGEEVLEKTDPKMKFLSIN